MKELQYSTPLQDKSLVGTIAMVTRNPKSLGQRHKYALISDASWKCFGYKACISPQSTGGFGLPAFASLSQVDCDGLADGDVVKFNEHSLTVLWEHGGRDNALMLTESCNCRCLMCPQPTKPHDVTLITEAHTILDLLKGQSIPTICLTGGEPTLVKNDFINILKRCVMEHPEAEISVLSNGKTFADMDFAKQVGNVVKAAHAKVLFCISLHSDIDEINDTIVGAKGSRNATENGIYNLAQSGVPVEIRHVITKMNFVRLANFAEYVYSYFPFCCHYAFMGMEVHGDAEKNKEVIYAAPSEYKEELRQAVLTLYHRGLPVSIYNIPLCMCHEDVRIFATQSISQWKNNFHEKCDGCMVQESCAGFFTTSAILPVQDINPIRRPLL
ncbi:MAG: His-Xaa-Ser system radical SAM maturase HxsC [Pseudomonadota bacterium]